MYLKESNVIVVITGAFQKQLDSFAATHLLSLQDKIGMSEEGMI